MLLGDGSLAEKGEGDGGLGPLGELEKLGLRDPESSTPWPARITGRSLSATSSSALRTPEEDTGAGSRKPGSWIGSSCQRNSVLAL